MTTIWSNTEDIKKILADILKACFQQTNKSKYDLLLTRRQKRMKYYLQQARRKYQLGIPVAARVSFKNEGNTKKFQKIRSERIAT